MRPFFTHSADSSWRLGRVAAAVLLVFAIPFTGFALLQRRLTVLEHPAINYYETVPTDSIAALQKRIDSGEVKLERTEGHGYLESILRALKIDVSSQILVTSKTSLQLRFISPETPRAIYFNDDTYVGWVQGSPLLEITTVDPKLGAVFYSLDQDGKEAKIERESAVCLSCHNPSAPGHVMTSTVPDETGLPVFHAGLFSTSDRSPLTERWGGWYVTGTHGNQLHMGNLILRDLPPAKPGIATNKINLDRSKGANVTDLASFFDASKYITNYSDIVALMILGHQVYVENQVTELGYAARKAIYDAKGLDSLSSYQEQADKLVDALLLTDEAQLTSTIVGTSGFAEDFQKRGPRDSRGRSLRDLDLNRRLFKYPLSYVIYSKEFNNLPVPARNYVSRRLGEVLTGSDHNAKFAHLSEEDRRAIVEIVRDTKPDLAATWSGR